MRKHLGISIASGRDLGLLAALVLLSIYVTSQRPSFGTFDNWRAILLNASFMAIPAMGTALLMIAGKIDLSIGSIYGFGAILSAWLTVNASLPWWLAMILGVVAGGAIGLVNGLVVRRIAISPLIVTLGSLTLIYGINLLITKGQGILGIPEEFTQLGRARPAGIPSPVWIWAVVAIVAGVVLHRCRVGRHVYAIGGNEEAASSAGLNIRSIVLWLFAINGALASLAGVLSASRLSSADANLGRGAEFDILTAVILGGVGFMGGVGSILGVALAVTFLAVIDNALVALSIDPAWSFILTGGVLIIAVAMNQLAIEASSRHQKSAMLRAEDSVPPEAEPAAEPAGYR